MSTSESDLISLLPYALHDKVHYYFDFVKDRLFEVAIIDGKKEIALRFEKDIELIFLLRFLYGYIVLGYSNYEESLRFFESLDTDGFQIGTIHYSRNASITTEWANLAKEIEVLVRSSGVERYMQATLSTDEIIWKLLVKFEEDSQNDAKENGR